MLIKLFYLLLVTNFNNWVSFKEFSFFKKNSSNSPTYYDLLLAPSINANSFLVIGCFRTA